MYAIVACINKRRLKKVLVKLEQTFVGIRFSDIASSRLVKEKTGDFITGNFHFFVFVDKGLFLKDIVKKARELGRGRIFAQVF